MAHYVYLFTFPNGKHYVGRTNDYEKRLVTHKYNMNKKKKTPLYFALNKYGWDTVEKKIIEEVDTLEECIIKEFEKIVEYDSIRKGYNITLNTKEGGNVWTDREDTQDFELFKEYMKKVTSGEKNGMYGKTHSEDTRSKMKGKAKGRFSLPWFLERYGEEGRKKYKDRVQFLKDRNMKRGTNGRFDKRVSE